MISHLDVFARGLADFLNQVNVDQVFSSEMVERSDGPAAERLGDKLNVFTLNVLDNHALDLVQEVDGQVAQGIPGNEKAFDIMKFTRCYLNQTIFTSLWKSFAISSYFYPWFFFFVFMSALVCLSILRQAFARTSTLATPDHSLMFLSHNFLLIPLSFITYLEKDEAEAHRDGA